jgi:hypothetical protein
MVNDPIRALEELLAHSEKAHAAYEATELKGVYDQDWPRWYAAYAVEHGIGKLLGREVTTDELSRFLANSWDETKRSGRRPTEPWVAYTARQIVSEL